MTKISIVSVTIKDSRKRTGVFYPASYMEIPQACLIYNNKEIHFWLTDDGHPPEDDENCMCGKLQYQ